jgi:ADP-heptose:LPS heptosyltransferase
VLRRKRSVAKKILVRNTQSPGDVVVLTAMMRDLHRCHPGMFETAVSTAPGAEHVFYESPYVSAIASRKRSVEGFKQFVAHYPLIKTCNQQRKHFMWGFIEDINRRMRLSVKLTEFKPDLYMSQAEKESPPFPQPYWVFLSGGKGDFKTKIWDQKSWQEVIWKTADRIKWVQCGGGSRNHIRHIPKDGILADVIAKTTLREFIKLIYHSEGVACVITAAMHIAAAFNKPCVVIAGGREPWWWEAYTDENRLVNMRMGDPAWKPPANDNFVSHKFLHTIGQLECCQSFGCWKKKVVKGRGGDRCKKPVTQNGSTIPQCKSMITSDMVVDAIDSYFREGVIVRSGTVVPGALDNTTYCVYADGAPDGWAEEILKEVPDALVFNHGTSRGEALSGAIDEEKDWIVWLEHGVELGTNWRNAMRFRCSEPGVVGRIHRAESGKLYPYPAFFAAHRELLTQTKSFTGAFADVPKSEFRQLGSYIVLPTEPRTVD